MLVLFSTLLPVLYTMPVALSSLQAIRPELCLCTGGTMPRLQMSISKQDGTHGFTTVLCVLAAAALGPVAVIRAAPNPMAAKGFGILTSIIFAVVLVNGQFLWPRASGARTYWHQVNVRKMYS